MYAIKTIFPIKKDEFYYYEKKSKEEWKIVRKIDLLDSNTAEELVFDYKQRKEDLQQPIYVIKF